MLNSALLLLCMLAPTAPAPASPSPAVVTSAPVALRAVAWADEPRGRAPVVGPVVAAAAHDTADLRDPFGARRSSAATVAPKAESLRDPFGPRRPTGPAPSPARGSQPLRDPFG